VTGYSVIARRARRAQRGDLGNIFHLPAFMNLGCRFETATLPAEARSDEEFCHREARPKGATWRSRQYFSFTTIYEYGVLL
jgi:hypothetical protein